MSKLITLLALLVVVSSTTERSPQERKSQESAEAVELSRLESVWNDAYDLARFNKRAVTILLTRRAP